MTLFDSSEQLRDLFFAVMESLPHGMLLIDAQDRLQFINLRGRQFLGMEQETLVMDNCWQILLGAGNLDKEQIAILQKDGGQCIFDKDGRRILLRRATLQSPFQSLRGCFSLTLTDLTYQTMYDAQQNRQRRYLAMQAMASKISEEMKNQLGSIELCSSVLQRELNEEKSLNLARQIQHAVHRMNMQLNTYLTYNELPVPEKKMFGVKEWLKEVIVELNTIAVQYKCHFRLQTDLGQQQIVADRHLLLLLALNAGVDCLENISQGSEITIGCRLIESTERCPWYEIQFEHEWADSPKKSSHSFMLEEEKSGVGVPVIHFIAEAHNGMINIDRNAKGWRVITVMIPKGTV